MREGPYDAERCFSDADLKARVANTRRCGWQSCAGDLYSLIATRGAALRKDSQMIGPARQG